MCAADVTGDSKWVDKWCHQCSLYASV